MILWPDLEAVQRPDPNAGGSTIRCQGKYDEGFSDCPR
jgi:hypothetical protein